MLHHEGHEEHEEDEGKEAFCNHDSPLQRRERCSFRPIPWFSALVGAKGCSRPDEFM
jgi:hypothetical protein